VVQDIAGRPPVLIPQLSEAQHRKVLGVVGHPFAGFGPHLDKSSERIGGNVGWQNEFGLR
jgi:hypothetical protein